MGQFSSEMWFSVHLTKAAEYIDKKLKSFFTDLLYKVNINGQEGFIYILYEHKSYHDEKTIFQLLKYLSSQNPSMGYDRKH